MNEDRARRLLDEIREELEKSPEAGDEVRLWSEGVVGAVAVRGGILREYYFEPSGITVDPDVNMVGEDEGIFSPERFIGYLASLIEEEAEEGKVLGENEGVRAVMVLLNEESDYVEYP